jgi:hypothetical protein
MNTPKQSLDLINGILVRNKNNIARLAEIYTLVETHVNTYIHDPGKLDLAMLNTLQVESKDLDKRIKDNVVTLNDLAARAIMTPEFYRDQANLFLKRVAHTYNNMPSSSHSGITIAAVVTFRNMGFFFSWTVDKGIFLNVALMDSDNNVILNTDYNFDTTLPGNEPLDENTNQDYLQSKTFKFNLYIPPCPSGDYVLTFTVRDATYSFFDAYRTGIQII